MLFGDVVVEAGAEAGSVGGTVVEAAVVTDERVEARPFSAPPHDVTSASDNVSAAAKRITISLLSDRPRVVSQAVRRRVEASTRSRPSADSRVHRTRQDEPKTIIRAH